jgi:hypothetical protein
MKSFKSNLARLLRAQDREGAIKTASSLASKALEAMDDDDYFFYLVFGDEVEATAKAAAARTEADRLWREVDAVLRPFRLKFGFGVRTSAPAPSWGWSGYGVIDPTRSEGNGTALLVSAPNS